MNLKKPFTHKQIQKMINAINQETLTQTEKAKEQNITVRWVKEKTRNGKLKPYYPKATVLYDKDET